MYSCSYHVYKHVRLLHSTINTVLIYIGKYIVLPDRNYHFGDMEAFYPEKFAQIDAQNALVQPQDIPTPRPKRAAAAAAPGVWKSLGPRERRRCQ